MTVTTGTRTFMGERVSRTATPRSRGALTGFGLVLLGAWGALIPFIGPYFHYAFTPDKTWTWTAARFWLQVLPGAVTFFAGLVLLMTAHRVVGWIAAWLAIAAGAWFVVGPLLAPLWRANYLGSPVGSRTDVSVEQIGMFYGLGAAIILLGAMAAGRFSVIGVRDGALAPARVDRLERTEAAAAVPATVESPTRVGTADPVLDLRDGRTVRDGTVGTADTMGTPGTVGTNGVDGTAVPEETPVGSHRHRRFVFR